MTQEAQFEHPSSRIKHLGLAVSVRPGRGHKHLSYNFGPARNPSDIASAVDLVTRRYAWRGYETDGLAENVCPKSELTLIATHANKIHGTLTVRLDRHAPLLSEELYPEEIRRIRASGGRLCEFGRLAFEKDVDTLEVLGPLFHLAVTYAHHLKRCTDALVEVHPRHEGFYRRLFGFELLGQQQTCPRVSAPAVLLRLPLPEAARRAEAEGGIRLGRTSIYPYCFGREQISPLHSTLRTLHPPPPQPVSSACATIYFQSRGGARANIKTTRGVNRGRTEGIDHIPSVRTP